MPSMKDRALMRLLISASMILLLPGCVGGPSIAPTPPACSTLVPEGLVTPVPGAPLPESNTVGDWQAFADAQTGQLEVANSHGQYVFGIITRCEARDRAAVQRARRRLFGIL